MASIEITYKCRCMSSEVTAYIDERAPGEAVEVFMIRVQQAVGADHRRRSMLCMSTTVEYAKIPFEQEIVGKGPLRH